MGLPLHRPGSNLKPKALFATIIPACEDWGPALLAFHIAFWLGVAISVPGMPVVKFEKGSELKTPHFHIGDCFFTGHQLTRYCKALTNYVRKTFDKVKPQGFGNDHKGISVQLFLVPTKETIHTNVLRGADLVQHYLFTPTKVKSVEGGTYRLDLTDWSVGQYLADLKTQLSDPDYMHSIFNYDPEKQYAILLAYAQKYVKYARTHNMPELSKLILENRPDIKSLEDRFSRFLPISKK